MVGKIVRVKWGATYLVKVVAIDSTHLWGTFALERPSYGGKREKPEWLSGAFPWKDITSLTVVNKLPKKWQP